MAGQPPTIVTSQGQPYWTQTLLDSFPKTYSGRESRVPGGGVYGMFNATAANLQAINDYLVYAFDSTRIETATGEALDLCAEDFYGNSLPRKTGESDDSYRARILAGLFIPYTTKQAFIQAITALTGVPPVLAEGGVASNTSAYDWSYYDVSIPARPALYGDPSLAYQVFVIADLPSASGSPQPTAIWGYDAGAAYDVYTGTYWNLLPQNFITTFDLDQLINRIKAFGITVWRKYLSANSIPFPVPVSFSVPAGQTVIPVAIQPYNNPYIVICSGNWNSNYWITDITNDGFTINTSAPSVLGSVLNYVIIPITQPEVIQGAGLLPIVGSTAAVPAPQLPAIPGNRVAISPSWNTQFWITSIVPGTINMAFSTPSINGSSLNYFFSPPGQSALALLQPADIANSSIFIPIAGLPRCCPFVTPSWNAQVAVSVVPGGIQAYFSSVPPNGAYVQWSYFPLN